jgi:hypothetical protein
MSNGRTQCYCRRGQFGRVNTIDTFPALQNIMILTRGNTERTSYTAWCLPPGSLPASFKLPLLNSTGHADSSASIRTVKFDLTSGRSRKYVRRLNPSDSHCVMYVPLIDLAMPTEPVAQRRDSVLVICSVNWRSGGCSSARLLSVTV